MLRYGKFGACQTQHVIISDRDGTPRLLCAHWTKHPLTISTRPFDDLPHCKMCQYMLGHKKRLFLTISTEAFTTLSETDKLEIITAWAEWAAIRFTERDWAALAKLIEMENRDIAGPAGVGD